MPIRLRLFLLVVLGSVSLPLDGRAETTLTPERGKAVDQAVQEEQERQGLVGVAVGVIEQGQVAHLAHFGWADREEQIPVGAETMFRWASISKTLTAIAALQLAEQGKLDLDADVRQYVPDFPDKGKSITARHLLCHQSGIVHYSNGKVIRTEREYDNDYPFRDVILALDHFKESPLLHSPGEQFSYSTHGYILLSAVVERAGGDPFATQIHHRIAKPLAMNNLQPDYQDEAIPHRAVGYRRFPFVGLHRSTDTDVGWKLGGGGYISTVDDLARYAAGLTRGELVSAETESLMWTAQHLGDGKPTAYGLGFRIESEADQPLIVSHNGSQEKTRTRLVIEPRQQRGVVIMTNTESADVNQLGEVILDALKWE